MQEKKKDLPNRPQTIKKMEVGTYVSVITLNVNGLNAPTKTHRRAEWIQIQDPYTCCLQETHFRPQDTYRLKVKRWKNIFHVNGKQKKAGVAIFISDKTDLEIKKITRDKEGHRIMIKGSIQEEEVTTVDNYAPNAGAPQHIGQTPRDIKGELTVTITVGDFNTHSHQWTDPQDRKLTSKHKS